MTNEIKKSVLKKIISNIKMNDMGHKIEDCCAPMSAKDNKNRKYYPSVYLSSQEAGFLKDQDVGEKKRFIIDGIIKSKTLNSRSNGKDSASFDIEIRSMGVE